MKSKYYTKEFDEELKQFITLPVKEKLRFIEEMQNFFDRLMPVKNKKIWEQLSKEGF